MGLTSELSMGLVSGLRYGCMSRMLLRYGCMQDRRMGIKRMQDSCMGALAVKEGRRRACASR